MSEIFVIVTGRGCGKRLTAIANALAMAEKTAAVKIALMQYEAYTLSEDMKARAEEIQSCMREKVLEAAEPMKNLSDFLSESHIENLQPAAGLEKRIKDLKKAKKRAKNPMELRKINQELNAAYAEKKHPQFWDHYKKEVECKW